MKILQDKEILELNREHGFWLKPIAKLNVLVELPQCEELSGKSISTASIIQKINERSRVKFITLKVIKSTLDYIKFEGELDSLHTLDLVYKRLDKKKIKINGLENYLDIRVNKNVINDSLRNDWEEYFKNNPQMDEQKPGYRPDTIHIEGLPLKWFGGKIPKSNILIKVFAKFGEIRRFHIPCLDKNETNSMSDTSDLSLKSSNGFKKFNFGLEGCFFDAYIMYKEYIGFVKAMDGLKGMKLLKIDKEKEIFVEYEIKVDFDKTKHLSDKSIRKRQIAKKYGINNLEELNLYKIKAKERQQLLEKRRVDLEMRKKSAKNLLTYIFRKIEKDEIKKQEKEKEKELISKKLLEQERSLRENLLKRKRDLIRNQLKKTGQSLKSIAVPANRNEKANYNNTNINERCRPRSFVVKPKR